jgi:hypothetical protein
MEIMGKLEGKIAVVTGGNSDIGLAGAEALVVEGTHVFDTGRRKAELDAAVANIGRNVTAVQGDVSRPNDLDRLYIERGSAAVVLADQQWPQRGRLTPVAPLVSCSIAALFALLACAFPSFAHEHPKNNPDSHFLDSLERPDNASNPSRNMAGTFNSRLCCTNQDAVKVDYEMVVPEGSKYPEPEWYVWIDLDGKGVKRVRVPPEKIVEDYAPTGQAYAFVFGHLIQCFVRPQPRI